MKMTVSSFPDLEVARRSYLGKVDIHAGAVRARHITDVPGQSATYSAKQRDAERWISDGEPADTTPYPWLKAEIDAREGSALEAAQNILAHRDAWTLAGAEIERVRMGAKYKIKAATSARAMHTIWQNAVDAMEAISAQLQ